MCRLQKISKCTKDSRNVLFSRICDRFDIEIDDIIKTGLVDNDENNFDSKSI